MLMPISFKYFWKGAMPPWSCLSGLKIQILWSAGRYSVLEKSRADLPNQLLGNKAIGYLWECSNCSQLHNEPKLKCSKQEILLYTWYTKQLWGTPGGIDSDSWSLLQVMDSQWIWQLVGAESFQGWETWWIPLEWCFQIQRDWLSNICESAFLHGIAVWKML